MGSDSGAHQCVAINEHGRYSRPPPALVLRHRALHPPPVTRHAPQRRRFHPSPCRSFVQAPSRRYAMTRASSSANLAPTPISSTPRRINSVRLAVPTALRVSTTHTANMAARIHPRASQIPTPLQPQRSSLPTDSISANSAQIPTIQIRFRTPTANTAVPIRPRASTTIA